MKNYKYLLIISVFFACMSCSEDFLERYPLDELEPVDFFKTPEELKIYANSFYTLLPVHGKYYGGTFYLEKNSDNMVDAVMDERLAGVRTIPSSGGGWDWGDIRQANYFFDHTRAYINDTSEFSLYIAEVMFFKAFLYFDKVKEFGDVPWFSSALTTESPELFKPRESRKVVVDSILNCLDYAIHRLPDITQGDPYRLNKETALLFKARVCLYEGTWEKYHQNTAFGVEGEDGSEYLAMAAQTALELMQMGTAGIYTGPEKEEYWSLFNKLDYSGNPEVLLWKKYDVNLGVFHLLGQFIPNAGGDIGITKSFMDSYLCTDGNPISVSPLFMGYDSLEAEAQNRDPRLAQTIFLPGDDQVINAPDEASNITFVRPPLDGVGQWRATTGYCLYKGVNPEYSQQQNSGGWMGSIIYRFSEALLIYAEAKAEMGTITQNDLDISINLLRDRVGMIRLELNNITTDPDWDFPELSPIINEVRRERRIELGFEGHRWDDLARWRAHQVFVNKRPKGVKYIGSNLEGKYFNIDGSGRPSIIIGETLFVDGEGLVDPYQEALPDGYGFNPDRDYLSPIPSDELTVNKNLEQNPGWN